MNEEALRPEDVAKEPEPDFVKNGAKSSLDVFDRVWRVYNSLHFGIFLFACIGVACIYGTTQYASNGALGENAIPLAKAHVFNATWFFGLLALFTVNLVTSTWHVTRMSFGIWSKRQFRRSAALIESAPCHASIPVPGGIEAVERVLSRRFTRSHRDGNAFFAHRGLLSRVGPTIVHAGLITIMVAGMTRAVLDRQGKVLSEGRFLGAEGDTLSEIFRPQNADQAISGVNSAAIQLPWLIRVLDFDAVNFPNSEVPQHFQSFVEVTDRETGEATVARLDMNHILRLGPYEFHQAGYQALPPIETHRTNLDIRDAKAGSRIAVTDITAGVPSEIGGTEFFIEADGDAPGAAWRVYSSREPGKTIASGVIEAAPSASLFQFEVDAIFPDFRIDPATHEPKNVSDKPNFPAVKLRVFPGDGAPYDDWLLLDKDLAAQMPSKDARYRLELRDLQVPADVAEPDWSRPGEVRALVAVTDMKSGKELGVEAAAIGARVGKYPYGEATGEAAATPPDARFRVVALGPTTRYMTILSVVTEPVVNYYIAGVLIIALGAGLTFVFRYRALYGLWDEEGGRLTMALVPRWGQSPVREEFDRLAQELSAGAPRTAAEPESEPALSGG